MVLEAMASSRIARGSAGRSEGEGGGRGSERTRVLGVSHGWGSTSSSRTVSGSTLPRFKSSRTLLISPWFVEVFSNKFYAHFRSPVIVFFQHFCKQCHGWFLHYFPLQVSRFLLSLYVYSLETWVVLGASIAEVANDAIVAEIGKQSSSSSKNAQSHPSGELQSFVWMASSLGGVLGNILVGIAMNRFSPQAMFLVFGIILSLQYLITVFIKESSLGLPKAPPNLRIKKQLSELLVVLQKPEISYSILWFAASYAVIPALTGTMFYYQTQYLRIESSVLGISKVFGQVAMLLWGVVYNSHLKSMSPRKLISAIQASMAVFMVSDVLFVKGVYRTMGIPDSLYVVVFSGFLEVLYFFKILPFSVLMAQLCPPGCEGSIMAFLMSAIALAFIVSGYLGVALSSFLMVTGNDFSGLPYALMIQAASTLVPLCWSSCIPDGFKHKMN